MTPRVTPFLMFQGQAEAALTLYLAVFPAARVESEERWAAGEAGPEGAFKSAVLVLGPQRVMVFDSPTPHAFDFTPSFSWFVEASAEDELDNLAARLGEGGRFLMPPGDYGFSRRFAWLQDRFGVSWQLNLA